MEELVTGMKKKRNHVNICSLYPVNNAPSIRQAKAT